MSRETGRALNELLSIERKLDELSKVLASLGRLYGDDHESVAKIAYGQELATHGLRSVRQKIAAHRKASNDSDEIFAAPK